MEDAVIIERAFSLVNQYMFAVSLQHKRIKAAKFVDWKSMCENISDFQFFILALCRVRKAAKIALQVSNVYDEMNDALIKFDKAIPNLTKLRNIGEHLDSYAIDDPRRHDKSVDRKQLQVESFDNTVYNWLGVQLNVDDAKLAAIDLFKTLQSIKNKLPRKSLPKP